MNSNILRINEEVLARTVQRCADRRIVLPTVSQMRDPSKVPAQIVEAMKHVDIDEVNPLNLFRVTWCNDPVTKGYKSVPTFVEWPSSITGVKARVVSMIGKYFPTGAHKVGATYCALVDALTSGNFDPERQKAMWPSTGNYCRGGAFNSALLGCQPIAVLPAGMSKERFEWLRKMGSEIHATPGCESNVKEVFDKSKELVRTRPNEVVNFNQFELEGNCAWHYNVTGPSLQKVIETLKRPGDRVGGSFFTTGSAGSIAAADFLREQYPYMHCGCGEAKQCPTIYSNGFGAHRIEGIGDKHIPWIFNSKTQDIVACLDDEDCMRFLRLFNEEEGLNCLRRHGVSQEVISKLPYLGISGVANMLGLVKMAKYYDADEHDIFVTVSTDSVAMYQSRLQELREERGAYTQMQAELDYGKLQEMGTDWMDELTYQKRKRVHHLKYFTWIEQNDKTIEELNAQWYDHNYWHDRYAAADRLESRIKAFNARTGVLKNVYGIDQQ